MSTLTSMKNLRSVSTSSIPNEGMNMSSERISNFNFASLRSAVIEKIGLKTEKLSYQDMKSSVLHLVTPNILFKAFTYMLGFIWLLVIILTIF